MACRLAQSHGHLAVSILGRDHCGLRGDIRRLLARAGRLPLIAGLLLASSGHKANTRAGRTHRENDRRDFRAPGKEDRPDHGVRDCRQRPGRDRAARSKRQGGPCRAVDQSSQSNGQRGIASGRSEHRREVRGIATLGEARGEALPGHEPGGS